MRHIQINTDIIAKYLSYRSNIIGGGKWVTYIDVLFFSRSRSSKFRIEMRVSTNGRIKVYVNNNKSLDACYNNHFLKFALKKNMLMTLKVTHSKLNRTLFGRRILIVIWIHLLFYFSLILCLIRLKFFKIVQIFYYFYWKKIFIYHQMHLFF